MVRQGSFTLPEIPEKLYFNIGEASKLVAVKPYVLRFWESEFGRLLSNRRRNGRRYYVREDILKLRHVRYLLYNEKLTIDGARQRLAAESNVESSVAVSEIDSTILIHEVVAKLKDVLAAFES